MPPVCAGALSDLGRDACAAAHSRKQLGAVGLDGAELGDVEALLLLRDGLSVSHRPKAEPVVEEDHWDGWAWSVARSV